MNRMVTIFCLVLANPAAWLHGGTPVATSATGTPLPAYRAFFNHVQFLEDEANKASNRGDAKEATELRKHHQNAAVLNDQEAALMKQIANIHVNAIDPIEKRAGQVIQAERAKVQAGRLTSRTQLPSPPAELGQLQKQRDDATTAHIQNLQNMLGASFSKLDAYVKTQFHNTNGGKSTTKPPESPVPPFKGAN